MHIDIDNVVCLSPVWVAGGGLEDEKQVNYSLSVIIL